MVSKEVEHSIFYSGEHRPGPWGLYGDSLVDTVTSLWIDAADLAYLNDEFDGLTTQTGQGYAEFEGDTVRLDVHHLCGERWVRSVSYLKDATTDGENWTCTSRISDNENGQTIYTQHDFHCSPQTGVTEPCTGSADVRLASDTEILRYHRTVSGAVPEPLKLPTAS